MLKNSVSTFLVTLIGSNIRRTTLLFMFFVFIRIFLIIEKNKDFEKKILLLGQQLNIKNENK